MTLLNLEELIITMSRYGDLSLFTAEKGAFCSARFMIGNFAKTYLSVETAGCSSHLQALNMINEHFYLLPSMPILRKGEIFLGDKVFGAIQKLFPTEHLSISVDNRIWSVSIEYERRDRGKPVEEPSIVFSYRDYDGQEDFSALMMKVYSRFKIPAEGIIILGPGGISPE